MGRTRSHAKEGENNRRLAHFEKGTDDLPAVQPESPKHSRRRERFHAQHARLPPRETVELPRNVQDSAVMGDAGIDSMVTRNARHEKHCTKGDGLFPTFKTTVEGGCVECRNAAPKNKI